MSLPAPYTRENFCSISASQSLLLAWIFFYFAFFHSSYHCSLSIFPFVLLFPGLIISTFYYFPSSVVPQSPSIFPSSPSSSFLAIFFLLHFRSFLYCPTPSNSSLSLPPRQLLLSQLCVFFVNSSFIYISFTANLITSLDWQDDQHAERGSCGTSPEENPKCHEYP
jgi:hypothetical protein